MSLTNNQPTRCLVIAIVAMLFFCISATAATAHNLDGARTATAATHKTYVSDQDFSGAKRDAKIRPRTLALLPDGNVTMVKAKWRYWRHASAQGRGRVHVYESQFGGKNYSFNGIVELSKPVHKCGRWYFSTERYRRASHHSWVTQGLTPLSC